MRGISEGREWWWLRTGSGAEQVGLVHRGDPQGEAYDPARPWSAQVPGFEGKLWPDEVSLLERVAPRSYFDNPRSLSDRLQLAVEAVERVRARLRAGGPAVEARVVATSFTVTGFEDLGDGSWTAILGEAGLIDTSAPSIESLRRGLDMHRAQERGPDEG